MAITATERTAIIKLTALMFNAAPGATYLSQIVSIYESNGHNLQSLAVTLAGTGAYQSLNPNFQTAAEFATALLTPLGLQNDTVAKDFVTARFNAGASKGQIAYEGYVALTSLGSGATGVYATALAVLNNKTEVAEYFSVTKSVDATDLATLQAVLSGVTADHATVVTAEAQIDNGTLGTDGIEATLSTSQDGVQGTSSADIISGLFGDPVAANNTYTTGDSIDGAAGTDTLNLVALNTTASATVTVKNVETINIQDTVGATFNALLVENAPAINFTSTLTGQTSTVTNAATGSTFGLAGKGNLTVDFATTTGTTDTANVSLSGAGTSTTARSTVNVSDTNTIEKVTVATSGSNFVTLTAGTAAASITVTGSGTNDFDMSAAGATGALLTLDASASTGTNTFRLGTSLGAGDTVKGGTGADTVVTNFTLATLNTPTLTGVETLSADFDAAAILDLSNATGLTTVTLTGSTADQKVQNALASVATVNVQAQADNDNDVVFAHKSGAAGPLTLNIGSAASTATAFNLDDIMLTRVSSLTVNTLGALAYNTTNANTVDSDLTAFNVNVAAGGTLDAFWTTVDGSVGARTITVGANGNYSGGMSALDSIGSITTTLASSADAYQYIGLSGGGDVGNITTTVTGNGSNYGTEVHNDHGDIGDISLTVTGNDNSGGIDVSASGGSVGNISISANGEGNHIDIGVSAGDWEGTGSGDSPAGNVGNINVTMTGDDSSFSAGVYVSGGDIGDASFSFTGDNFSASVGLRAVYELRDTDDDGSYDDYAFGGNIGDITYFISGQDASGGLEVASSGGSIGNLTLNAEDGASLHMWVSANSHPSGLVDAGSIGNVTISMVDGGRVSGYVTASGGDIGNVSVSIDGDGSSGGLNITASSTSGGPDGDSDDHWFGGNVGDVSLTIDGTSTYTMDVQASGGDIGDVTVSINGNGASGYLYLGADQVGSGGTGGDIGAVTVTLGDDTSFGLGVSVDGTLDAVTINGGAGVSGWFYFSGGEPGVGDDTGEITSVAVTLGADSSMRIHTDGFSGSIGPMSITMGTNADVNIDISTVVGSVAAITLAGGDSSSLADIDMTTGVSAFGGIVATSWAGDLSVDLSGVTTGTTIQVGAGGSDVLGTEGADNVFFGAGVDQITFDATPTSVDQVFNFTGGAGKDVLDVANAANFTAYTTNTADTLASGDFTKLTDIAGGQDITTAAGLLAALNGGEYALIDATAAASTYTFVTASSAASTTYYVFNAVETADASFDSVTLIGIVNGNAFSNLIAANVA